MQATYYAIKLESGKARHIAKSLIDCFRGLLKSCLKSIILGRERGF